MSIHTIKLTHDKPATLADLIAQEEPPLDFEAPRLGEGATTPLFKEVEPLEGAPLSAREAEHDPSARRALALP